MKKAVKRVISVLSLAVLTVIACVSFAACGVKVESITFSETSVSLDSNGTHRLVYTVQPENAAVKVEISDEAVVKYENDMLTALTAGEATVKVYAAADEKIFAECSVTVAAPQGYTLFTRTGCKFVYPSSWTKTDGMGTAANFEDSNGSSINLITESRNNSYFSATADDFKDVLIQAYGILGFTATFTNCTVANADYLGYTRVHVVYDYTLTYDSISADIHQEQMILNSGYSTYTLTVNYSAENFDKTQNDTIFSQFVGLK